MESQRQHLLERLQDTFKALGIPYTDDYDRFSDAVLQSQLSYWQDRLHEADAEHVRMRRRNARYDAESTTNGGTQVFRSARGAGV